MCNKYCKTEYKNWLSTVFQEKVAVRARDTQKKTQTHTQNDPKRKQLYVHISKGHLSQQQEADGVRLRGVTVVCTLGHHVGKVHTFAKHVTSLGGGGQ